MAIYHMTTNIAGLLRNCTDKKLGQLFDMNGKQARKELQGLLDKGDRLLPSDNCKHFDPQEGCKCRFHESGEEKKIINTVKYAQTIPRRTKLRALVIHVVVWLGSAWPVVRWVCGCPLAGPSRVGH